MDTVLEDDLSLLQRLWPACKFTLRREAARLLLQDPDHRLRTIHLEALLNVSLNREITSLELQAELCHVECAKYFKITPETACDWSVQVVKLLFDVLAQDATQHPPIPVSKLPYLLSGAVESEKDQQVLLGVVSTWNGYEDNDEDYLAVIIAWVLITKKDSKGQLPNYSLHLTDVGGFLRSLTVSDPRLAHIFPRAGGGVFVSKRQKQTAKARPRLSEYLMQSRYRPFFRIKDSCVRKSEKVVSLVVERLVQSTLLDAAGAMTARVAHDAWLSDAPCKTLVSGKPQFAPTPVALLPDFLDGMDAPYPNSSHSLLLARGKRSPLDDLASRSLNDSNTSATLAPYLDPVIDHPPHVWHHRSASLFSPSCVGSAPLRPPTTPHLNPALSRFSSSFPEFQLGSSLDSQPAACFRTGASSLGPSTDVAYSNLLAAFRPEAPFYHHGVEYVAQVPEGIAKCWAASFDELMTKAADGSSATGVESSGQPVQLQQSGTVPDDDDSDDGSVSLENCMIPEDSDGCESSDDAEQGPHASGDKRKPGSSMEAGQQLLKLLSTGSSGTGRELMHVPSFAPSTPSFFASPSQSRQLGSSTDSDADINSSTRSSSSDIASDACTSPAGTFASGDKALAKAGSAVRLDLGGKSSPSFAEAAMAQPAESQGPASTPAGSSLANWAAVAAKHAEADGRGGRDVVFTAPPSAESKVAAAAAAAQVPLPPGAAKNLAKLSARLRDEVLRVVRICPAMKVEDFDEGVVSQLMAKRSEDDAAAAIKSISQHDLTNIQHMAAFINFVVKNYAGTPANPAAARGSIGGLVSRTSSIPVSSRTILQKLPLKVYKHLEEVVGTCSFLEWKHFDAGVVKVLSQLAKMADDDVCEELDILLQTDLSNVEYMPAYLNKRFNNRLWSRRKVTG